jgi:acyl carrier protein
MCEVGSLNPREIFDNSTMESLGLDSLDATEIVMEIENTYEINLDDITPKQLVDSTVVELAELIEKRKQ